MDDHTPALHCLNCGTDFKPMQPLEHHAGSNTWGYPCPVCQFQVSARKRVEVRRYQAGVDLETQLSQFLSDARANGAAPDELVRCLRDELEFAVELAHPGRWMVVNIIDLGEDQATASALPIRDIHELRHGRSLAR